MLITALILLMALLALLPGLRHPFFVLHLLFLLPVIALLDLGMKDVAAFSYVAFFWSLLLHMVFINLTMMALYYQDKRAAKRGAWRVSERTMHAFMLAGGTLGAFLGQRLFRHKLRKASFMWKFWLLLALQVMLIAGFYASK